MTIYSIVCADCGERRAGTGDGRVVTPFRDACGNCGASEYSVPAADGGS